MQATVGDCNATVGATRISATPCRIALLTDFGAGPYIGQMQLLLCGLAPGVPAVSLISNLPAFRPDLAAYTLPWLRRGMPGGTIYTCVVDPGVGTERDALAVNCGADWWVGPDNGLLVPLLKILEGAKVFRVRWRPERLSASFHGRDLFLPVAAELTRGVLLQSEPTALADLVNADWPAVAWRVCYVDAFGNLMTGVPADRVSGSMMLQVGKHRLQAARTFAEVPPGTAFWYRNAFDLVEIAVNQGRADEVLDCGLGAGVLSRRPAETA
jgi:S-adenosylmethionine hydrolase